MRHDISYPPHCPLMRSQYIKEMRGHFRNKDGNGPLFLDVVQPALDLHTYIWDRQVPNFSAVKVHTILHPRVPAKYTLLQIFPLVTE